MTFKDISTKEGENRTLAMYNPNGGIWLWASRTRK